MPNKLIGCSLLLLLVHPFVFSQSSFDNQITLYADNDAFWLNNDDGYYSSGIFIEQHHLKSADTLRHSKTIRLWRFSHLMYTSSNIRQSRASKIDRPYAGILSIGYGLERISKNRIKTLSLDLGWMGPSIRTGDLQYGYHSLFGMKLPRGWDYEVKDTPVITAQGSVRWPRRLGNQMEIINSTSFMLGSIFNKLNHEVLIRLGDFLPIHQSSLFNTIVGTSHKLSGLNEFFMTTGMGVTTNFYDATIQGSIISEENNPFSVTPTLFVFHHFYSLHFSWTRFNMEARFNFNTKENQEARPHRHIRIRLDYRY